MLILNLWIVAVSIATTRNDFFILKKPNSEFLKKFKTFSFSNFLYFTSGAFKRSCNKIHLDITRYFVPWQGVEPCLATIKDLF